MAKRQTRTNAETLENVRRQGEAAGRALGRQDLAVELWKQLPRNSHDVLGDVGLLLYGLELGGARHRVISTGQDVISSLLFVIAQITKEANTPAF